MLEYVDTYISAQELVNILRGDIDMENCARICPKKLGKVLK